MYGPIRLAVDLRAQLLTTPLVRLQKSLNAKRKLYNQTETIHVVSGKRPEQHNKKTHVYMYIYIYTHVTRVAYLVFRTLGNTRQEHFD